MTLCDWIVLLELVALAVAAVRIWQLGRDRDRVAAELDEAYLAGAAVRIECERVVAEQALAKRAVSAMEHVGDQAGRQIAELQSRVRATSKLLETECSLSQITTTAMLVAQRERDSARRWLATTVRIARRLRADRDALSAELAAAHVAGAAAAERGWQAERRAAQQMWRSVKRRRALHRVADHARDLRAEVTSLTAQRDRLERLASVKRGVETEQRIADACAQVAADGARALERHEARTDQRARDAFVAGVAWSDGRLDPPSDEVDAAADDYATVVRAQDGTIEMAQAIADRAAHADRAQQLARRVTELEEDLEDAVAPAGRDRYRAGSVPGPYARGGRPDRRSDRRQRCGVGDPERRWAMTAIALTARAEELAQEIERHDRAMPAAPWPATNDRDGIAALRNAAPELAAVLRALVAELADARASIDNLKAEIMATAEEDHTIRRLCAERGFLLANTPLDGVRRMANRYDELVAEVEGRRPVVAAAESYVDEHGPITAADRQRDSLCIAVDAMHAQRGGR